jgi:hypothetical protein
MVQTNVTVYFACIYAITLCKPQHILFGLFKRRLNLKMLRNWYLQSSVALIGSIALIALVLPLQVIPALADSNPNPGVLPPQSLSFGKTYGEWSNAWWQWALSIPASVNPLLDPTGANCGEGQSGPVWFLAGTTGGPPVTRSCTVPAGKALFFPIVNFENNNLGIPGSTVCPPTTFSVDQLHQQLDGFIKSVTTLEAQVDTVPIQDIQSYRAMTDNSTFSITLPSDNLFSSVTCPIPAGTYAEQVSDGYYLMLAPLKPGTHTIHLIGAASAAPGLLNTEVTYNLTVGS